MYKRCETCPLNEVSNEQASIAVEWIEGHRLYEDVALSAGHFAVRCRFNRLNGLCPDVGPVERPPRPEIDRPDATVTQMPSRSQSPDAKDIDDAAKRHPSNVRFIDFRSKDHPSAN